MASAIARARLKSTRAVQAEVLGLVSWLYPLIAARECEAAWVFAADTVASPGEHAEIERYATDCCVHLQQSRWRCPALHPPVNSEPGRRHITRLRGTSGVGLEEQVRAAWDAFKRKDRESYAKFLTGDFQAVDC
jgi:hypothetical protein